MTVYGSLDQQARNLNVCLNFKLNVTFLSSVHPDKVDDDCGLRRSRRTRVKRIEWYKNERIIYDHRRSGPVVMAIQPSRERLYLEQEKVKSRRRKQLNCECRVVGLCVCM
jgi:hypothetical protein